MMQLLSHLGAPFSEVPLIPALRFIIVLQGFLVRICTGITGKFFPLITS